MTAGIVQRAREVNLPPLLVTTHGHAGVLPAAASLASLDSAEIELTALKPAAVGDRIHRCAWPIAMDVAAAGA